MNLQPIATAPRDGSFVLVAGPSGYTSTPLRFAACRWRADCVEFVPHLGYRAGQGAWVTHSNDRFTDGGDDATQWCPL